MPKPRTSVGYDPSQVQHVRATCLYIATKLGDLVDEVVIVGGLVPSLIVDQNQATSQHAGTLDLDVGLSLALLDEQRYHELAERLRHAGFTEDVNEKGKPTHQRWRIEGRPAVTVDFLIPPGDSLKKGGTVWNVDQIKGWQFGTLGTTCVPSTRRVRSYRALSSGSSGSIP